MKLLICLFMILGFQNAIADDCEDAKGEAIWASQVAENVHDYALKYEVKGTKRELCYGVQIQKQIDLYNSAAEYRRISIDAWNAVPVWGCSTVEVNMRKSNFEKKNLKTILQNIDIMTKFKERACQAVQEEEYDAAAAAAEREYEYIQGLAELNARAEEDARAEVRAEEAKRRNAPTQLIPAGNSSFIFNKEILINIGKSTTSIGTSSGNVKECIFVTPADNTQQRRIKAGREFKIRNVETIDGDKAGIETSFSFEGTSATISCFASHPNIITIGEVSDSLSAAGVSLVLPAKLAEPVDI